MFGFEEFLYGPIGSGIMSLLTALVILVVGFIIAKIIASIVRNLLKRTDLDNRFASTLAEPGEEPKFNIEDVAAKVVFWIVMLFILVATFERVGLYGISEPISSFLNRLTSDFLPRLGGAALLLFVAWIVASVLRFLVRKGIAIAKLDEKLAQYQEADEEKAALGNTLSAAVFWFVFLLFLPAVLNTLGIASLADPIQGVFDQALLYIPNIFGAAMVLGIGWFGARIIRQIVSNLLAALGVDKYGERAGISGERTLSEIVGNVLYIFILLIVIISALDQLNIEAISGPATEMLNTIVNIIPAILGATIVLIAAYAIGKVIANLVGDLLANVGFDALPKKLGMGWNGEKAPSAWISSLTLIMIMVFAATSAAEILGSVFLVNALNVFIAFLSNVILAIVIVALGLYFANVAHEAIAAAKTKNAVLLAKFARFSIIVFSFAMGLGELGIADEIVDTAFSITLGAIGVAVALAFGLGSREAAGREVERFIASMREDEE